MRKVWPILLALGLSISVLPQPAMADGAGPVRMTTRAVFTLGKTRQPARVTVDNRVSLRISHEVRDVHRLPGGVVALIDSYQSRTGPMARCQAGAESWLRILAPARKGGLTEKFARKIESCTDSLVPADPAVEWRDETTFALHLLDDGKGGEVTETFRVVPSGAVQRVGG